MTILIQSRPSSGARAVVQAINDKGVRALRRRAGATTRIRSSSFLVNWGVSSIPVGDERLEPRLNHQNSVASAVNKLFTFHLLKEAGVSIPPYAASTRYSTNTTDSIWLARHRVTGHGGEGITVVRPGEEFPDAPLYVQYIPKLVEFRVHVFQQPDESRILLRQKLRSSTAEQDRDQRLIRNHANGWVFGLPREPDEVQDSVAYEAIKAVKALGLDFGAVDVIIGRDDGKAYVLEVNTAPGADAAPVIEWYADSIIEKYHVWRNQWQSQ